MQDRKKRRDLYEKQKNHKRRIIVHSTDEKNKQFTYYISRLDDYEAIYNHLIFKVQENFDLNADNFILYEDEEIQIQIDDCVDLLDALEKSEDYILHLFVKQITISAPTNDNEGIQSQQQINFDVS